MNIKSIYRFRAVEELFGALTIKFGERTKSRAAVLGQC